MLAKWLCATESVQRLTSEGGRGGSKWRCGGDVCDGGARCGSGQRWSCIGRRRCQQSGTESQSCTLCNLTDPVAYPLDASRRQRGSAAGAERQRSKSPGGYCRGGTAGGGGVEARPWMSRWPPLWRSKDRVRTHASTPLLHRSLAA